MSSAHLEKDFSILINTMGIIPEQFGYDNMPAENENGPRRQEFDGFTFFGVEDGLREDEDDDSKDGAGATGGYIDSAAVTRKLMNDFIIPMSNPNNSAD